VGEKMKSYKIIVKSELQRALADNIPYFADLPKTTQKKIVAEVEQHFSDSNGLHPLIKQIEEKLKD
jgi:hypothetical protein